ncbi:Threonine/homoserine efflux transporter RhtA [Brevibacterium sp. Mu109]|uniref:EamA family transporter n=1 Tax=Brevibacterium sp. Mu109 TaxID=1255669 RepID=UPI000C5E9BB2|nr:DMT family transporter [Brevibacterium sp. Mu109]SMX72555.1 Threonine/homoserine efflux transporter RhtA [Brevibacterium sp. Mu109]
MNRTAVGFGLVLLSAFFFAASGPYAKAMYASGWSPGAVVLLRLLGCALVLLIPTIISLRGRWREVVRGWRTVVSYGVVSMAGVQLLYFLAVEHLAVAVALLLEMTAPLLIVFWLWATTRIRPATVTFVGMAVSLVGLVLVLDPGGSELSLAGVVFALGAAVCLASYFMVSAKVEVDVPPVALTGLGMAVGTLVVAGLLLLGVLPADFSTADVTLGASPYSWVVPILIIVFTTVGAYVCGILGLRMVGATVGSFVNLTEVPFSVIVAWLVVAELPSVIQMYGGIGIVVGVVFIKWGEVRQERRIQRRVVLLSDPATGPLSIVEVSDDRAVDAGSGASQSNGRARRGRDSTTSR